MFSRARSGLVAAIFVASLAAPAAVSASDGFPPDCSNDSITVLEDHTATGNLACTSDDVSIDYALDTDGTDGHATVQSDGSFTFKPIANANGDNSFTFTGTDSDGPSTPATITVHVTPVNDAPSFTKGPDKTVSESSSAASFPGWATGISKGPADESGDVLNFVIDSVSVDLFSVGPAVSPSGTLSFTPTPGVSGDSLVTLHLHDDGGIAGGGDDTSPTQTFTISISSINHVPSFTKGIDQTDLEDAGLQSVTNWATAISQGAGDTGQTLTFVVDSNSNSGLFSSQPAVSPSGTLTYTPKANANGSASITLHLEDDGGTLNGGHDTSAGQTFTINVTPVNDAPSFTKGPDKTVSESSSAASFPGWATGISKGPADEIRRRAELRDRQRVSRPVQRRPGGQPERDAVVHPDPRCERRLPGHASSPR